MAQIRPVDSTMPIGPAKPKTGLREVDNAYDGVQAETAMAGIVPQPRDTMPAPDVLLYLVTVAQYGRNPTGLGPAEQIEQGYPKPERRRSGMDMDSYEPDYVHARFSWVRGEYVTREEVEAAGYQFERALANGTLVPAREEMALRRLAAEEAAAWREQQGRDAAAEQSTVRAQRDEEHRR